MKVLLVDDEKILLDSMEGMVDWTAYDLEIVGKATNGLLALQLCEETKPDLVITDIKMGTMDGLELTKQLGERFPQIKVIIMSSFDDFSYAKKAIELKVSNYLLKISTDKSEFLKAILEVKRELELTPTMLLSDSFDNQQLETLRNIFKGKLDFSSLDDASVPKDLLENPTKLWIMVATSFDDPSWLINYHFSELHGTLQSLFEDVICTEYHNILYSYLPLDVSTPYRQIVTRLKSRLSMQYSPCSVGVSSAMTIDCVHTAFLQSKTAIAKKFYIGKNCSIYWNELDHPAKNQSLAPAPYEIFSSDISTRNYTAIKKTLLSFFDKCNLEQTYSSKQLFRLVEYIILSLSRQVSNYAETGLITEELSELETITSLNSLRTFTLHMIEQIQLSDRYGNTSTPVARSIQYIMENYKDPISLNEVADYVNVSPAYLSKLFKKEVGENITWYIQSVKIQYAKQMLLDHSLNIIDIAHDLGFDSASYFASLFQKHTKCSPSEYRKLN